ncbi:unnamed protein product [Protopolystoma xenopodis]|uniref:Uncharacterized protein n=1 Tax=Protopolystoma xenopodis TaxID=117903 RepID=A0A3S5BIW2_9PLAT|nr:unnamed protein product [Protopolystoma xenopodis]
MIPFHEFLPASFALQVESHVYMFVCMSICLSVRLTTCPSVLYLTVCLFVCLLIRLPEERLKTSKPQKTYRGKISPQLFCLHPPGIPQVHCCFVQGTIDQ